MNINVAVLIINKMLKYTIDDISKIIDKGITYELTDDVMQTIQHLAEQVGAADYVRTPQFQRNGNRGKKKSRSNNASTEISNDDWEAIRNFQATEIAKKAGIDAGENVDLAKRPHATPESA